MKDTRSVERSVQVVTVEVVMELAPDGTHVVFADCVKCGDRLLESRRFPSDWGQNKLEVHFVGRAELVKMMFETDSGLCGCSRLA